MRIEENCTASNGEAGKTATPTNGGAQKNAGKRQKIQIVGIFICIYQENAVSLHDIVHYAE